MTQFKAFLVSLILSLSVAFATDYPLSVTDELGREVVLQNEPQRIVTMVPSHTETLCALGTCDKLAGVDTYSNYPPEVAGLPELGDGLSGADVEAIVVLDPDLVLVTEYGELAQTLAQAGLTVYAGSPQTFAETSAFFRTLGELVNREGAATELAERVQAEVEAVADRVARLKPPRVYYEIDATPYSVGPDSFIGFLIAKAGGDNIVTEEMGDFPLLDPEFIIAADPQVIVLSDAPFGESAESVAARPGWGTTSAVEEGRVYALTSEQVDMMNRAGPRLAEAVRLLAEIFHPDAF